MSCFRVFLILVSFFCSTAITHACSWAPPTGNVSDWVEDKTIFWGRPLESKWDRKARNMDYPIHTYIELLEPLKGNPPKIVKVRHHTFIGMCGTNFELGRVQLVIIRKNDAGTFTSDETLTRSVHPLILYAHLTTGTDFSIEKTRESIEKTREQYQALSEEKDNICSSDENSQSDHCKWEKFFYDTNDDFNLKREMLDKENKKISGWI